MAQEMAQERGHGRGAQGAGMQICAADAVEREGEKARARERDWRVRAIATH
jgi:hypothetical protein